MQKYQKVLILSHLGINKTLIKNKYEGRFKVILGLFCCILNHEIVKYKNKIYYEISLSDYNMFRYIQM